MSSESRLDEIEARLGALEDREAIRQLRYRYAYAMDEQDWDRFLSLFTDDATIRFPQAALDQEPIEGQAALAEFCRGLDGRPFTAHMMHNGELTLDGDRATGRWYFEVPEVLEDGSAVWVQGRYEDEYERVDGEWKFATVAFHFNYNVDYDEGWQDQLIPAAADSE